MHPDQALSDEIEHDVKRRYEAGTPYSSRDFEGMTDEEHHLVLQHSATLQRGAPEDAMLRITRKLGSGVYSYAAEHMGDIYHRAQEHPMFPDVTHDLTSSKVLRNIRDLNSRYGFEREMRENLISNSKYDKDPSINWDTAVVLGKDYAHEHSRLPVYNEPAYWATQATQHLGNMRFGAASAALQQIAHHFVSHDDFSHREMHDPDEYYPKQMDKWVQAHSRQAGIDFLRSQGR